MSKLDELIAKFCPNGVEFRKLKDITLMQRGTSLTRKNATEGIYPVISGGIEPAFYCDKYNREGETITVAGSGAGAGYVQYWNEPIFVCDAFSIKGQEGNLTKYIYYCLANLQDKIFATKTGGGIPHVYIKSIENFIIPVPPKSIQQEIINILDNFTELTAELTAELIARRKQYEYYRDLLLTFDDDVPRLAISDLLIRTKGTNITAQKMRQLHKENGEVRIFAGGKTYADVDFKDIPKKDINLNPSIIVKSRGIIEFEYYDKPFSHKNEFWSYYSENKNVNIKFVYYYLSKNVNYFQRIANNMQMPQISIPVTDKYKVPLPPIKEQERIVAILDRFDALCNDLTSGIPAEIEARQKQYEYYRDKLLSFKELKV